MKTNLSLFLALVLFSIGNVFAKTQNSAKLDSLVEEARTTLQKEVRSNFKDASGLQNFTLRLDLEISKTKLFRSLGLDQEQNSKMNNLDLPGLFVDQKESYAQELLGKLRPEDIYKSIRNITFSLNYYDSSLSQKDLETIALRVVGNQIPTLMAEQVIFKMELNSEIKAIESTVEGKLENIAQSLQKPLEVEFSKYGFSKIFSEMNTSQVILSILAISATLGIFVWMFFRIGNFIKEKDFNINVQGSNKQSVTPSKNQSLKPLKEAGNEFKDYMSALSVLKNTLKNESALNQELLLIASTTNDFELLTILFDTISKDQKSQFMQSMPDLTRERFKTYIANDAISAYRDNDHLKERSIKVIKLIKVCAMDPDQFYTIVLNDFCSSIPQDSLGEFFKQTTPKETSYLSTIIDPSLISYFIGQNILNPKDVFQKHKSLLSKGDTVELLIKISSFVGAQSLQGANHRLQQVFAHLPGDFDHNIAKELGMDSNLTLDNLYLNHKQKAKEYLDSLDVSNLISLAGCLTPVVFDDYKTSLPDLLQETLSAEKLSVSHHGIELKGRFYTYLKSITTQIENDKEENFAQAA